MANFASTKQIAELLKVTEYDVKKFVKEGMPKEGQNKFNATECVHWYIAYLKDRTEYGTVSDMALLLNKTERYVNKLAAEKGFPKVSHGKYNRVAFIHAYLDYKDEEIKKAKAGGDNSISAKDSLLNLKAKREEIKLMNEMESFLPVDLVEDNWMNIITIFSKALDSVPVKIINKLLMCRKKEEMMAVLKEAIEQVKNVLYQSNIEAKLPKSDSGRNSKG